MTPEQEMSATCTRCGATTIDVPTDLRTGKPSWPCRPCRRETQRERDIHRREPKLCSHHRCTRYIRSEWQFCYVHRPKFGA